MIRFAFAALATWVLLVPSFSFAASERASCQQRNRNRVEACRDQCSDGKCDLPFCKKDGNVSEFDDCEQYSGPSLNNGGEPDAASKGGAFFKEEKPTAPSDDKSWQTTLALILLGVVGTAVWWFKKGRYVHGKKS